MTLRALVLGANGQDGSYLVESLLALGAEVVGLGRDAASRHVPEQPGYRYIQTDLRHADGLQRIFDSVTPQLCFHVAAVHGAVDAGFTYEAAWRDMMSVNVFSLHALLEHARLRAPGMHVVYAGSAKVFPAPWTGVLDENTPMQATCLYGIGKLAARDLMAHYRREHGVASTNLILFNHDSPRRPAGYFLPSIAQTIRRARQDPAHVGEVRSLSFRMDWSAADEIMAMIARAAVAGRLPDEMVVASGQTVIARDAVAGIFSHHGLAAERQLREVARPCDPGPEFRVDISRFEFAAGGRPKKSVIDILEDMLKSSG